MKVLFIFEKYQIVEEKVLSHFHHTMIDTYDCAFENDPNYTYEFISTSKPGSNHEGIQTTEQLVDVLENTEFDICLFTPRYDIHVPIDLAKKLGKKLFIVFWDTPCGVVDNLDENFKIFMQSEVELSFVKFFHSPMEYAKYCNILVLDYGVGEEFPNIYGVSTPVDDRIFKPSDDEKIYDVSFLGSTVLFERMFYKDLLKKSDLKVHFFGGSEDKDRRLTIADYAKRIQQSKISLNFNSNNITAHRKGRAYEIAACGGFMLATFPEIYQTKNGYHFIEGEHFKSINPNDAIDKIKYYLKYEHLAKRYARKMHQHYLENFTAKIWWENIFKMVNDK